MDRFNKEELKRWLKRSFKKKISINDQTVIAFLMAGLIGMSSVSFGWEYISSNTGGSTGELYAGKVATKLVAYNFSNNNVGLGNNIGALNGAKDSVALGSQISFTKQYAEKSVAIGYSSQIHGDNGTVVGSHSVASGRATAIGFNATADEGQATSIGNNTGATAQSVALGADVFAGGNSSIAIGSDDISTIYKDVLPDDIITSIYQDKDKYNGKVTGVTHFFNWNEKNTDNSDGFRRKFMVSYQKNKKDTSDYKFNEGGGYNYKVDNRIYSPTYAKGTGSIAIGSRTVAAGNGSTSLGTLSFSLAEKSTTIGLRSFASEKASGATALGEEAHVFAEQTLAIGNKSEATQIGALAVGRGSIGAGEGSVAIGESVLSNADLNDRQALNFRRKFNYYLENGGEKAISNINDSRKVSISDYNPQIGSNNTLLTSDVDSIVNNIITGNSNFNSNNEDLKNTIKNDLNFSDLEKKDKVYLSYEAGTISQKKYEKDKDEYKPNKNGQYIKVKDGEFKLKQKPVNGNRYTRKTRQTHTGATEIKYEPSINGQYVKIKNTNYDSAYLGRPGIAHVGAKQIHSLSEIDGNYEKIQKPLNNKTYDKKGSDYIYQENGSGNYVMIKAPKFEEYTPDSNVGKREVKETKNVGDHATSIGYYVYNTGNNSFAGGTAVYNEGNNSVALGTLSLIEKDADNSVAIGVGSSVLAKNSVSIGTGTSVYGENSLALGVGTSVGGNIVAKDGRIEYSERIKNSLGIGFGVSVNKSQATAVGAESKVNMANSVALGYLSETDYPGGDTPGKQEGLNKDGWIARGSYTIPASSRVGVLSIGKSGAERRIINVASGAYDTDAVNVAQLKSLEDRLDLAVGDSEDSGVKYYSVNTTGELSKSSVAAIKKEAAYKDYVKLKEQQLTILAKQAAGDTIPKSITDEVDKKVSEIEGKYITFNGLITKYNNVKEEVDKAQKNQNGEFKLQNGSFDFKKFKDKLELAKQEAINKLDDKSGHGVLNSEELSLKEFSNIENNRALGTDSIAAGFNAVTSPNSANSIALGNNAQVGWKSDPNDTSRLTISKKIENQTDEIYINTYSLTPNAIAIGNSSLSIGYSSISLGNNSITGSANNIGIGVGAQTLADGAIALGSNTVSNGDSSIVIGKGSRIGNLNYTRDTSNNKNTLNVTASNQSNNSIAIGSEAQVGGKYYINKNLQAGTGEGKLDNEANIIYNTNAPSSIALGNGAYVKEQSSLAIGSGVKALEQQSVAIGNDTDVTGKGAIAIGSDDADGYNEVLNDTVLGKYKLTTNEATPDKYARTRAKGNGSIAIGAHSIATDKGSLALGVSSASIGEEAAAIGVKSIASGQEAFAGSKEARAAGARSIAIGHYASTGKGATSHVAAGTDKETGEFSVAIGSHVAVTGQKSVYVGKRENKNGRNYQSSAIASDEAVGLGYNNQIGKESNGSVVIGRNITVGDSMPDAIVIGTHSYDKDSENVVETNGIAIGKDTKVKGPDAVAIGSGSVAKYGSTTYINDQKEYQYTGYDQTVTPDQDKHQFHSLINSKDKAEAKVWVPTGGEFSVGNEEQNITRRITNVAAGRNDTDAVNVAQLKKIQAGAVKLKFKGNETRTQDGKQNETLNLKDNTLVIKGKENSKITTVAKDSNTVEIDFDSSSFATKDDLNGKANKADVYTKTQIDGKTITFKGNAGDAVSRKLGEELTIKGEGTTGTLTSSAKGNISVEKDTTQSANGLVVRLSDNL
ncbi:hypothetical protein, partial [Oceanivirga miroungae]|uniref:hypothetical protein n=1 Tax=Oceanivirga miroungae TaxID=1130046 RepID=UPI0018D1CE61